MNFATGIDLIEIDRVEQAIARHGQRFLERIFTPGELSECSGIISLLAERFAAKEAVAKALGAGIGQVSWREIEVVPGAQGEPVLLLYGEAARLAAESGLEAWYLSMSHTSTQATAIVVATAVERVG
jgi:holo-[acyl-carrier protein] synthase